MPPATASSTLSISACVTICRARRANGQPQRRLRRAATTARASSRLATLAQAMSSTSPQTREQDLQAAAVLFLHHADAGAGGNDVDDLFGSMRMTSGIQLAG